MVLSTLNETKIQLLELADKSKKIAILTHSDPDADGICTAFALKEIFENYDIKSDIVLESLLSDNYPIRNCNDKIRIYSSEMTFDTVILLDCHEEERVGKCASLFQNAERIIAVDHHIAGHLLSHITYFIDPSCVSVGAIIYQMFKSDMESFPQDSSQFIATNVYGSIINDTDNFVNANVDKLTFMICAELMEYNINPGRITESILAGKSPAEIKFTGEVLSTIQTYYKGKLLFMNSTKKMLLDNGLSSDANSKMTSWVKGIKGVELVIFFQETEDNIKLSLRSNSVNVNAIAVKFGGGGHIKASGCTIKGTLTEVQSILLSEISPLFHD